MIPAKNMGVKTRKGAIKPGVLKKIKGDSDLIAKIIFATGKSYPTVIRWVNNNSVLLTQAACLNVICSELKLEQSDVLN